MFWIANDETEPPVVEARIQRWFAPSAGSSGSASLDVPMEGSEGFTIVFGASGAGKTTLLNCIAGISRTDSGRIVVSGTVFFDAEKRFSLPVAQRRIGYVFQ